MDFLKTLDNNSILIIPSNIKDKILDYINNNKLLINIKLLTFRDLKVGLLYDYTNEGIYFIMKKYNISYSIAKSYINDTYYLDKDSYDNPKLKHILEIRNELEKNNLLIKDTLFINLLKSKSKIYLYGFSNINKFNNYLLNLAKQYNTVEEIPIKDNNYKHDIYELSNMNEEIKFVADRILDLVSQGIDINNIYIANYSDEYYFTINRIFKSYGIPFYLRNETSLYQTSMGLYVINNHIPDKDKLLYKLRKNFDVDNNSYNYSIYNKIFNLLNTYTWTDNLVEVKDLLINELKNIRVSSQHHDKEVTLTSLTDNVFSDDEYVFLIGYNLGSIPKFKKDEDYISDDIKTYLQETTNEYNTNQKDITIKSIKNIKNLIITYKLITPFNEYQPSFLVNKDDVIKVEYTPSHYNDNLNKLDYSMLVDRLIKFGEMNSNLPNLKNTYKIDYKTYDNKFTGINNKQLIDLINDKIRFSYSNIKLYYQCPFEFYIGNVLNIQDYEQQFGGFIGELFHHVLENCLEDESKDIETVYYDFIKEKRPNITNKEKFFCNKLLKEMFFIVDTIKEQYKHSKHDKVVPEKKFVVNINRRINTIIKGFADKILFYNDKAIIIDYKTNDESIDLDLLDFGCDMQLPTYLYLMSKDEELKDKDVIGLYIQNILGLYNSYDPKKDLIEEKKKGLKLNGITFTDYDIQYFDDTYDNSEIIKNLKTKDGDFKLSKAVIDINERQNILDKATELIEGAIDKVSNGEFEIHPLKIDGKVDACQYCKYKDICYKKYKDFNIKEISKEVEHDEI